MVLKVQPLKLKLTAYGLSDIGLVRQNNEDVWGSVPEHHFYALADGMGGHQAGEVASREAILFLCNYIRGELENKSPEEYGSSQIVALMERAIQATNRCVYEMSTSHELLKGMGTTLCCLYVHDEYAVYAHVGDSRIYRLRGGRLEQLTQDHSLLRELIDQGLHYQQTAETQQYKNIITKAIGTEDSIETSIHCSLICPNDIYLLCSDGLSDVLSKAELEECLNQPYTVEEKVRALIHNAKHKGGFDNITVVLVEVTANTTSCANFPTENCT